jgi:hypothetical protein
MNPSKSLRVASYFVAATIVSFAANITCSKSTDSGGGDGGGGATAAYYGLKPGTSYRAHYYDYVQSDGRLFTIDSLRFDVEADIGPDTTYHGVTAIPVHIQTVGAPTNDSVSATVFLSVKEKGLYWHGIRTCASDFALAASVFIAPYPITDSATWLYANLIPARVTECAAGLASSRSLDIARSGPSPRTVQGTDYAAVYNIEVIYKQDHYELWFGADKGVIFASEFVADSTFTTPTQGMQVYEIQ